MIINKIGYTLFIQPEKCRCSSSQHTYTQPNTTQHNTTHVYIHIPPNNTYIHNATILNTECDRQPANQHTSVCMDTKPPSNRAPHLGTEEPEASNMNKNPEQKQKVGPPEADKEEGLFLFLLAATLTLDSNEG